MRGFGKFPWAVAILALGFAALLLVAGGAVLYFLFTNYPVHPTADAVPSLVAEPPPPRWSNAVENGRRLARSAVKTDNLPGVSLAVAVDGTTIWAEAFGWADIDRRVPATPRTQYRIGNVSMPLTAAAAGLLLERGALDLDVPVQRYVPAFPEKEWPVTTRQLLAHVAGIRRGPDEHEEIGAGGCGTAAEALERFAGARLRFKPGTEYRYSTYGYVLASAVIEAAANERFFRFMEREVFEPLAMRDTEPDAADAGPNRASFYFPRMAARTTLGLDPARPVDYSCLSGAAAFLSTPSDLVRFAAAMMKPSLLKPATITLLQTPVRLESGKPTGHGLGWAVDTVSLRGAPTRLVAEEANPFGSTTVLMTFPDHHLAIAAASNVSYATGLQPFAMKLAELFARGPTPASAAGFGAAGGGP